MTTWRGKVDRGASHSVLTNRNLDGEVPGTAHPPRQPVVNIVDFYSSADECWERYVKEIVDHCNDRKERE